MARTTAAYARQAELQGEPATAQTSCCPSDLRPERQFKAPHPSSELVIVARLDAADDAIELLRLGYRSPEQRCGVSLFPPAVADVCAPIDARPGVYGQGRRRVG